MSEDLSNVAQEQEVALDQKPKSSPAGRVLALVGFVFTVVAWVEIIFNEYVSGVCAIVAMILSIVACCLCRKGFWRDMAITAILATVVLLLVFALFFFGIRFAINSL